MIIEEHFDECPYTDKPCKNAWDCANCEIETAERLWAEDCDNDCEHCEWATCPKMEVEE